MVKLRSKITRSEEGGSSGFVWAGESDPGWIRFRTDPRSGVMTGFHIGPCNGTVPLGTPFKFRFRNGGEAVARSEGIAMLILGQFSKDPVHLEGEASKAADPHAQLAAWQDFLGSRTDASLVKTGDRSLVMSRDVYQASLAGSSLFRNMKNGELSLNRANHLQLGAPMSGFDVVAALRGKSLPFVPGQVGDLDLDLARDALSAISRPSSAAVAWYASARGDKARYRIQAARSMPILAGLIAESRDLSRAVDACEPLHPLLAERMGLSKASIKRITKLRAPVPAAPIFEAGEAVLGEDALGVNRRRRFTVSGVVSIEKALRHLAELPPDRTPLNDREWEAFHDILSGCAIPISNAFNVPVAALLEASKGNWVEYRSTLARAADFDPDQFDRRVMALTTIDAIEAIEGFSRTALMPQVLQSIASTGEPLPVVTGEYLVSGFEASARLVLGNTKNLAAHLFEVARRYAGRITAMMEAEGRVLVDREERPDQYGETSFPILAETFLASNGLIVRPLRNFDDLREEGRRMSHCVGTYTAKARDLRCHLFSIRTGDEARSLSTLELAGISGEDPVTAAANLRIIQNRAPRNGNPDETARAATREFVEALKDGRIPIHFDEVSDWKRRRAQAVRSRAHANPETTWRSVLEHDWQNEEIRNTLWAEWRSVMGGRIGKATNPGVIYVERAARDLVASMSPRAAAILLDRERGNQDTVPHPA